MSAATQSAIPADLVELDRWVLWRTEAANGRQTKVPYSTAGRKASSTDPATWASLNDVLRVRERIGADGIGFVVSDIDDILGIDLDGCLEAGGNPREWARPIIERFADAYIEVTPSGFGLRIFCRGSLPGGASKKLDLPGDHTGVEIYASGRYLTFTGDRWRDAPLEVPQEQPAINWLLGYMKTLAAKNNGNGHGARNGNGRKLGPGEGRHDILTSEIARWARACHDAEELLARAMAYQAEHFAVAYDKPHVRDIIKWVLQRELSGSASADADGEPDLTNFNLTDAGNAERLVALYGADLRYSHTERSWYVWNGKHWERDESSKVLLLSKQVARRLYRDAGEIDDNETRGKFAKFALASESTSRRAAALIAAQAEPGVAVSPDDLDSDGMLLNVQNGTLDLRTGALRPHRKEDLITKLIDYPYDPEAPCPRWERALREIFEPHPELIPYIQRALGYSLTASVREETVHLPVGKGGNGKGVLFDAFSAVMGPYATTVDARAFLRKPNDHGPRDDVANMRGARFVYAQETEKDARLSVALVKWLTGGDTVRARRLHENSYQITPTWKLWIAFNDPPKINETGNGIWRRIHLIPFNVSFDESDPGAKKPDRTLKDALKRELPGILAWAVRGCLEWQREGLKPPTPVKEATAEYRLQNDQIARFLVERTVLCDGFRTRASDLYAAYKSWAMVNGEEAMSGTVFGTEITGKHLQKKPDNRGTVYLGVRIATDNENRETG